MKIIKNIKDYKKYYLIIKDKKIGFVPTMGALHQGHISLIKEAKKENDIVIVSIFVNPLQFGPQEDFSKYPRQLEIDIELAKKNDVDIIFCPDKEDILKDQKICIDIDIFDKGLCADKRKGHFKGVATIVAKLFNIIKPNNVYFGQKDYQQCFIIKKMIENLNFDIEFKMCPIIREQDGLAKSSRNKYLSPQKRQKSTCLYNSLQKAKYLILEKKEKDIKKIKQEIKKNLLSIVDAKIDYIFIGNSLTLKEEKTLNNYTKNELLIAIAVFIGKTRLIDNILI